MTPEEVAQFEEVMERYDFSPAEVLRLLRRLGREIQAEMNLIINGVPGHIEPIGLAHAAEVEETMRSIQEYMGWADQNCPGLVETEDGCSGGSPEMIERFCSKCAYWEKFCESAESVIQYEEVVCAGRRKEYGEFYQRCKECIGLAEQIREE